MGAVTAVERDGQALAVLKREIETRHIANVTAVRGDVLAYRNSGAMKAVPGFDVIDYGQEDYVFGNAEVDARHWNKLLLDIFQNEEYAKVLEPLSNQQ